MATVITGGPIAWAIASVLSLGVGGYFAYKRYQNLSAKVNAERHMASLATKEIDIDRIKEHADLAQQQNRETSEKSLGSDSVYFWNSSMQ